MYVKSLQNFQKTKYSKYFRNSKYYQVSMRELMIFAKHFKIIAW